MKAESDAVLEQDVWVPVVTHSSFVGLTTAGLVTLAVGLINVAPTNPLWAYLVIRGTLSLVSQSLHCDRPVVSYSHSCIDPRAGCNDTLLPQKSFCLNQCLSVLAPLCTKTGTVGKLAVAY